MQVFPAREHHGLAITLADDPTDLLGALIKPVSTSIGQFQRVSAALNSPGLTVGTELGALLASLPENGETWLEDRWPVAVGLEPLMNLTRPVSGPKDLGLIEDWGQFRNGRLRVAIMADAVQSAEDLDVYATQYPTLAARDPELPVLLPDQRPGRVEWSTPYGNALEVHLHVPSDASDVLSAYTQALDELAPQYRWLGRRWLRPAVEGSNAPPGPLMTWWAILYALSMLARYHPVEWTQALDRDKAASAVVLERLLDLALEALPHLVFEALLSPASGALLPPGPDATPVSR
jgi:cell wall-associated NlpC family hydrolase